MSHSQFHCTGRVYLDLHGLIFETSICYWQDQPGSPRTRVGADARPTVRWGEVGLCGAPPGTRAALGPGERRGEARRVVGKHSGRVSGETSCLPERARRGVGGGPGGAGTAAPQRAPW